MSEITVDTFLYVIQKSLKPPLFLLDKEDDAGKVVIEIRHLHLSGNEKKKWLQPSCDLLQQPATDEVREDLTQELIQLAEQTLHHSNHVLTACVTKEEKVSGHQVFLYVEEKEVFHRTIQSNDDIKQFIGRFNQLIQLHGSN